ncbi:unnamed protein product [Ectocarpus sp. 8 AP-2014]
MRGKTHIWPRVEKVEKRQQHSSRRANRTRVWSGFKIQDRSACLRRPASTWNCLAAKIKSGHRTAAAKAKRASPGNYAAALAFPPSGSRASTDGFDDCSLR